MPVAALATLVRVRSALEATGIGTVTVPGGVGSGVVLVTAAELVTTPVLAVTVALTTMVSVAPTARLLVLMRLVLASTSVGAPLLEVAPMRLSPALSTSVSVTSSAVLGPRFTSVSV